MSNKKILIVTPRFPYPVVGGDRLRIYQICKILSKKYDLTLLSLCDKQSELRMDVSDDGVFKKIYRIYMPKWLSWLNCIVALPTKTPLQVAYFKNRKFNELLNELSQHHHATLAHLIRVGDSVKDIAGIKFLEMTDAISLNYKRIRESDAKKNIKSLIFSLESIRLKNYEVNIVEHFSHSFLVSDVDREFLFGNDAEAKRVSVFSNGVDLSIFPFSLPGTNPCIVFIGNMHSLQNIDAVNYMVYEIFPLIRKMRPDTIFKIIGRIRDGDFDRLNKISGVIATGEVPSISKEAGEGCVAVCPLRLGAGVQNKILEYMALGMPVVTTSIGLEGFAAVRGREILIADSPVEFSSLILDLFENNNKSVSIALAARNFVEKHHSWDAQLVGMVNIIESHLQLESC